MSIKILFDFFKMTSKLKISCFNFNLTYKESYHDTHYDDA